MSSLRLLRSTIACLGIVAFALVLNARFARASGSARHAPDASGPASRVTNEVIFKGLTNTALGGATLTLSGDQSAMGVCCCAGTLEECGFSVALRQGANGLGIAWNGLTLPESKAGDQLISAMRGVVGGVPDVAIGTLTTTIQVNTIDLVEDFSPVGATSQTIEVRSGGVLVHSATYPNAQPVSMVFPPGPGATGSERTLIRESPTLASIGTRCEKGPKDVQSLQFATGQTFDINGTLFSGNNIRFARTTGQAVDAFTAVETRVVNTSGQSGALEVGNEVQSFPDTVRYQGLTHSVLGTATLHIAPDGGTLAVSNIGSSGNDGVAIDIGRAQGFRMEVDVEPAAIPQGAYMESRSFSSGSGAGTLHVQRASGGFVITPDFQLPGVPTYTATARSGGAVQYIESGLSGGAIYLADTGNPAASGRITVDCDWAKKIWTISWDLPLCGILAINGHASVSEQVEMKPDAVTPEIELDALHVVASGMPQLVLHEEGIHMFGLPLAALGGAHFDFPTGLRRLPVMNLGSSGEDGVEVQLGRAVSVDVLLDDVDASFTTGSSLESTVYGQVDGTSGQPLGTLTVTRGAGAVGDAYELEADLASIGATGVHVQVFDNHTLVADIPGHGSAVGSSTLWPRKIGKLGGTTECFVACYPSGNAFFIDGSLYVGDEIRMLAEGSTHTIGPKERWRLRARADVLAGLSLLDAPGPGTTAFTITGIEGEFLPPLDVPSPDRALAFRLDPVWPNPSRGTSSMRFTLPAAGRLRVDIYDVNGRRVRELANDAFGPGSRVVTWNGYGQGAQLARAGVYFVRAHYEGAGASSDIERRIVRID